MYRWYVFVALLGNVRVFLQCCLAFCRLNNAFVFFFNNFVYSANAFCEISIQRVLDESVRGKDPLTRARAIHCQVTREGRANCVNSCCTFVTLYYLRLATNHCRLAR